MIKGALCTICVNNVLCCGLSSDVGTNNKLKCTSICLDIRIIVLCIGPLGKLRYFAVLHRVEN